MKFHLNCGNENKILNGEIMNSIAFIVDNGCPTKISYIKRNPTYEDIAYLRDVCITMGDDKHTLVYLDGIEFNTLKQFID